MPFRLPFDRFPHPNKWHVAQLKFRSLAVAWVGDHGIGMNPQRGRLLNRTVQPSWIIPQMTHVPWLQVHFVALDRPLGIDIETRWSKETANTKDGLKWEIVGKKKKNFFSTKCESKTVTSLHFVFSISPNGCLWPWPKLMNMNKWMKTEQDGMTERKGKGRNEEKRSRQHEVSGVSFHHDLWDPPNWANLWVSGMPLWRTGQTQGQEDKQNTDKTWEGSHWKAKFDEIRQWVRDRECAVY